jgi:hypothetical protein
VTKFTAEIFVAKIGADILRTLLWDVSPCT